MSVVKKLKRKASQKTRFITPHSDLSSYSYTRSWEQGRTHTVYGYEVEIPDMPPEQEMINYGRPMEEQVFRKTEIPKDLYYWEESDKEAFIEREHHRRREGLWFIIKGKPTYITGLHYYFMNYWPVEKGRTDFRMADWRFWILWMHVVRSKNIYGLIVFKCRRLGETEKALCIMYEFATRVRDSILQMYDCRTEDQMKKTWRRFIISQSKMIWYMRPVIKQEDPAKILEFRMRKSSNSDMSKSFIREDGSVNLTDYEYPEMNSDISYYTNTGGADGSKVRRIYVDEFGKKDQIDPNELWSLAKLALSDDSNDYEDDEEGDIIGKSLFTSSVEELKTGESLDIAKQMWDDSDPDKLDDFGRTTTGMIRVMRGAVDRASVDRYGEADEKATIEKIRKRQKFLIDNRNWSTLQSERRQDAITIDDVFSSVSSGSSWDLEIITNRLLELNSRETPTFTKGNLEWVDGKSPIEGDPLGTNKMCRVYFVPNDKGRWSISQHPKDLGVNDNSMNPMATKASPGNANVFAMGIDPTSYKENLDDKNKSLAGLAIKSILNLNIDQPGVSFDENGKPLDYGRFFKTNRYVCTYLYRFNNPSDNYMDWLKTMVYYGTDFLIEKNHSGGFYQFLESLGFLNYYQDKSGIKNYKGQQEALGLTATEKTVQSYFSAIGKYVSEYGNCFDIPEQIDQLMSVEYDTRTRFDLAVATGFCEIAAAQKFQKAQNWHQNETDIGLQLEEYEENY